jgi:hypothetical protein
MRLEIGREAEGRKRTKEEKERIERKKLGRE